MANLKVVALISGGKDSLFSILHCLANGHEVVALANLHPPYHKDRDAVDDLDSYMYQTIGHAVVPLYEEALGLPLYRQEILGNAVDQSKSYRASHATSDTSLDETESLVPLLERVKAAHPEVNAISSGAILSEYQRTRVESVAMRLGLTPLSYLWQWPSLPSHSPASLLEDMGAVGQDARIVKVASGGLDETFLWQNVADQRTIARLTRAAHRFGSYHDGAVLGEGGEYETLAISGPKPLWHSAIIIDESNISGVPGDAGSASVSLRNPRLSIKSLDEPNGVTPRIPPLWDNHFQNIMDMLVAQTWMHDSLIGKVSDPLPSSAPTRLQAEASVGLHVTQNGNTMLISNLTADGLDAAEQTRGIMMKLLVALDDRGHRLTDVAYTSIILRDMADFPQVNAAYGSFFTEPNPPSRVTVACSAVLSAGTFLAVSATSIHEASEGDRKGLHVQSRSYWAPANIGPYSQAVSVHASPSSRSEMDRVVYVAGQIPLVPASMQLVQSTNRSRERMHQTILGLQHLVRIGKIMEVGRWIACIAFVAASASADAQQSAVMARQAWNALHDISRSHDTDAEEPFEFDVWDVMNRPGRVPLTSANGPAESSALRLALSRRTPPLWVFHVDSLPRGSSIEWVGYGSTTPGPDGSDVPHLQHLLLTFQHHLVA